MFENVRLPDLGFKNYEGEMRFKVLNLAKDISSLTYNAERQRFDNTQTNQGQGQHPNFKSVDEIISMAEKMYKFISPDNN